MESVVRVGSIARIGIGEGWPSRCGTTPLGGRSNDEGTDFGNRNDLAHLPPAEHLAEAESPTRRASNPYLWTGPLASTHYLRKPQHPALDREHLVGGRTAFGLPPPHDVDHAEEPNHCVEVVVRLEAAHPIRSQSVDVDVIVTSPVQQSGRGGRP